MIPRIIFLASLVAVARSAQPGAPAPVAAPMRDLEWGQINIIHTTDIHGWLGGHMQEPQYSADWGDYISFTSHMRQKAEEKGVDLLVIDTGDRIEGNGLYDASNPKGNYTYDIFGSQSIDLLCTGNHELYQEASVAREHNTTVPKFKHSYIASNLDYIEPETGNQIPQAQRYVKFTTKKLGYSVVALGFIFDFDRNANNSVVTPVEEAMKQEWFQAAIREKPDIFLVIGHVGLRMKEFEQIFKVIRDQNWYTPIAFLGGHAHVRDARKFDDNAFAIASGRYFETIGWVSIDGIKKKSGGAPSTEATVTFKRRYIDNNLFGLHYHTGLNETTFPTEQGRNVTKLITEGRKALKLDDSFGCAPQDLWMSRAPYPHNASIFSWLETQVLPTTITNPERKDVPRLAIVNTGAIRFDIFQGPFTKDSTFLITPFISKFNYIADVPYAVASKVLEMLNSGGPVFNGALNTKYLSTPEQMAPSSYFEASLSSNENAEDTLPILVDGESSQKPLTTEEPELIGGYTTRDDLGDDGDDAVHSPIKFYAVPNCIQSKIAFPAPAPSGDNQTEPQPQDPEKVDLVFVDYVQPWIITALKFSGGDFGTDDVKVYTNSTLTDLIADWVKENWKKDC
ncbi:Metallo-dependent phosphatase-like protein [Annulohypoxylon maeteangense]|uniref:Metallo-dependent phosphatase-like protein n=1 Tax=Annulohypoxylon maeteangense TaxID=1927788 RepID=UPI002007C0CE|nr:Metallo-dependent phosphatase-like protein [Annulohypoxylon maeteangense]KAI0883947.1 Metallo-dependent phosphatase-like protein [Annulohypoxylon maeteangense]